VRSFGGTRQVSAFIGAAFAVFGATAQLPVARVPAAMVAVLAGGVLVARPSPSDTDDANAKAQRSPRRPITALAFTKDGTQLFAAETSRVRVYTLEANGLELGADADLSGRFVPEREIATVLPRVVDLAVSPDGARIALAGGRPAEEGGIEVIELPSGAKAWHWVESKDLIHAVAWSPDGSLCAAAGHDHTVSVLDANAGTVRASFLGHSRPVLAIAFTADGELLVSAGEDASLRVWNVAAARLVRTLENHTAPVVALAPRPLAKGTPAVVASIGEDRSVRFFQPGIGRLVRFARLSVVPRSIAWSGDAKRVIVGTDDGRIVSVDAASLEIREGFRGASGAVQGISLSPSSGIIAIGSERGEIVIAGNDKDTSGGDANRDRNNPDP
jgi:WD40 repeat protein